MSLILLVITLGIIGFLVGFTVYLNDQLNEKDEVIRKLENKSFDYYESATKHEMAYKNLLAKTNDNPKVNRASQVKYDALQKQYDELHVNVVELRNHITRLKKSKGIK